MVQDPKERKPFVILCGDLIRAVQTESEAALAHNWGVNKATVWKWRKALNVGRMTAGTTHVFRKLFESRIPEEVIKKVVSNQKARRLSRR